MLSSVDISRHPRGPDEGRARHRRRSGRAGAAADPRPARRRRADHERPPRRDLDHRDARRAHARPRAARRAGGARPRRRSACGSTTWGSGCRSSTSAATWSTTTARCWCCSTWSPPRAGAAGSRCRSPRPGSPSRWRGSTASTSRWTSTAPDQLTKTPRDEGVVFAGDGRGGFVIPEFHVGPGRPRGLRPAARAGGPYQADAVRDRRPHPRRQPGAPDRAHARGRPRARSCARWSRRRTAARSTPPTAYG